MTRGTTRDACVPASHPALPGHFPDAPIVPAAWQLTLVEQACRDVLGADLRIVGVASARFRAPWLPGVGITITVSRTAPSRRAVRRRCRDDRVADGVLIVDPPEGGAAGSDGSRDE